MGHTIVDYRHWILLLCENNVFLWFKSKLLTPKPGNLAPSRGRILDGDARQTVLLQRRGSKTVQPQLVQVSHTVTQSGLLSIFAFGNFVQSPYYNNDRWSMSAHFCPVYIDLYYILNIQVRPTRIGAVIHGWLVPETLIWELASTANLVFTRIVSIYTWRQPERK